MMARSASTGASAAAAPGSASPATRRFARTVIGLTILYGLWAAVLSFRIVVEQQAVRQHLSVALRMRPPGPFASPRAARSAARRFVARLDRAFPHNPCARGPAVVLAPAGRIPRRDCLVVIVPGIRRLRVRAYDTQGHRMDNVFERMDPPPRRL